MSHAPVILDGVQTAVGAAHIFTGVEGIIRTNPPLGVKGRCRGFGVKGRGCIGVKGRGAVIGIDAAAAVVVVVAARRGSRGPVVEDHTLLDAETA